MCYYRGSPPKNIPLVFGEKKGYFHFAHRKSFMYTWRFWESSPVLSTSSNFKPTSTFFRTTSITLSTAPPHIYLSGGISNAIHHQSQYHHHTFPLNTSIQESTILLDTTSWHYHVYFCNNTTKRIHKCSNLHTAKAKPILWLWKYFLPNRDFVRILVEGASFGWLSSKSFVDGTTYSSMVRARSFSIMTHVFFLLGEGKFCDIGTCRSCGTDMKMTVHVFRCVCVY